MKHYTQDFLEHELLRNLRKGGGLIETSGILNLL